MIRVTGYSDRINHAFAFAAKHHDRQVRKGTALPYLTHPANVAVILTRYGQDEETVLAGILLGVVEDCVRDGDSRDTLADRLGAKFGPNVLDAAFQVARRTMSDDGDPLDWEEQRADQIERLATANTRARWVCAADKIHNGSSILTELRRTQFPESVWQGLKAGREETIRWYGRVHQRLRDVQFEAPIMDELRDVVSALEAYSEPEPGPAAR
jgi:(p)ppGpp synthase/HD superfamily hydrolase